MASINAKRGSNAVLYMVLTIGIVVFVNAISSRVFHRVDLTEDAIYSLSDASRKLVSKLPDRLTAKFFVSGELPPHPQLRARDRYIRDLLAEYAAASSGKMVWEALDPDSDEEIKKEATRLKVFPGILRDVGKTKFSVAQTFMGIAFQYGGKVESIPLVQQTADLEYQVSSAIRRLTTKRKKVGFSSGHGEPNLTRGLAAAQQNLKDYEVTTVDLTEGKTPVPEDVDLLVVVGPTKPFADRAKYELDQFLQKGKALAFFLDGTLLETPRGQFGQQTPPRIARENKIGLAAQLEYYGVKTKTDIIMDRQNMRVQLPAGRGQIAIVNYPAFGVVNDLDEENPITRKLKSFVTVFPSSVELTKEVKEKKAGVSGTVLARSSQGSWRHEGFFLFDPLRQPKPSKELGPFTLGVALQGTFKSFFDGKPVPAPGPASGPTENVAQPKGAKKSPATARLVVFGDADLIKDQFLGVSQGANLHLLLNTVDYLAADESLIAIRGKSNTRRPLRHVEDSTVTMMQVINIVGLPVLFIAFGLIRWRVHRARRRRQADEILRLRGNRKLGAASADTGSQSS